MEDLIAAMKDRPRCPAINNSSAEAGDRRGDRSEDVLAVAPWQVVRLGSGNWSGEHGGVAHRPASVLEKGAIVGRHFVLDRLGAGGMGVVYAAYDPELDRKVALKLLLPGVGGDTARTRLLREAQALAKLTHPNVVGIHDVGTIGEQIWLAMELVQGKTLGAWLKKPRTWREVVRVMRNAGKGLAAAHAVGMLHRDFKPDNVMVGDDGRVRVMDFGLARVRLEEVPYEERSELQPDVEPLAIRLTQSGALVGTPAYMAPEQIGGAQVTAAADQFAFCVTLWEALYGERPFGGRSLMQLMANVLAGRRRPPPKGRGVPSWLRRACERGLSGEPQQRWPSMEALLDTLAKGRVRARVRKILAAVGVLTMAAASVEAHRRYDIVQRTAACEATGNEVEGAWNPDRREKLYDALIATNVSYAATTADKTMSWLDQQAAAWREARVDACLNTDVRGQWKPETLDRSLWCMDERLRAYPNRPVSLQAINPHTRCSIPV